MRARTIKPGFFKNEELAALPAVTRILFAGLWCMADRDGRLEDRPKRIKAEILPYEECDIDACLNELASYGFIVRYVGGPSRTAYIAIPNFLAHQNPHPREIASAIPAPDLGKTKARPRHGLGNAKDMPKQEPAGPIPLPSFPSEISIPSEISYGKPTLAYPGCLATERFDQAWNEWKQYRKQAKLSAYVAMGEAKQLARLEKMGHDNAIAAIEHSIASGYHGIYEPRKNQKDANRRSDEAAERRAARSARDFAEPEQPMPFLDFDVEEGPAASPPATESEHSAPSSSTQQGVRGQ